jgi:hypothetical protein
VHRLVGGNARRELREPAIAQRGHHREVRARGEALAARREVERVGLARKGDRIVRMRLRGIDPARRAAQRRRTSAWATSSFAPECALRMGPRRSEASELTRGPARPGPSSPARTPPGGTRLRASTRLGLREVQNGVSAPRSARRRYAPRLLGEPAEGLCPARAGAAPRRQGQVASEGAARVGKRSCASIRRVATAGCSAYSPAPMIELHAAEIVEFAARVGSCSRMCGLPYRVTATR